MNLQHLLSGVVPVEWMSQIETLPSFAIDDEFDSKETEFKKDFKNAKTAEEREEILNFQQELAQKRQQWNNFHYN